MGYIRNAVLIQAPVDDVFRLTKQRTHMVEMIPLPLEYSKAVKSLEESDARVTFQLTTPHPDETGQQWSLGRATTHQQRACRLQPIRSACLVWPLYFQRNTEIRWWYDPAGENSTVMTWEQEFTMKP